MSALRTGFRRCHRSLHRLPNSVHETGFRALSTSKPQMTQPAVVSASFTERTQGKLSEQNLQKAVRQVHHDGLVVIQNAVDTDLLDKLNHRMVSDALVLRSRGKDSPFNYNPGNLQQDPPPVKEFFHRSIFLNPIATQITSAILGPCPKLTFCSGNSAMPPTPESPPQRQPVHSDADFMHPDHPFALVVNVPLVDISPANGSTEIWLGTHNGFGIEAQEGAHGERASGRIQTPLLEERARSKPPLQPQIPKGSIVVRDLRLWHAGMPNTTPEVRVMLAMIHFAPWYRNQMRLELAEELKPFVDSIGDLDVRADFVSEGEVLERYLNRGFGNSYDFGQSP